MNLQRIFYVGAIWGVLAGMAPAWGMGARPASPQDLDGIAYVRIDRAARAAAWEFDRSRLILRARGHTLRLVQDRRQAHFDDRMVWLHEPIRKLGSRWGIAEADLRSVVKPLFDPVLPPQTPHTAMVVMLDAGHGGEDSGARGSTATVEKALTLDVCNRVRGVLLAHGIAVERTRTTDRSLPLLDRPQLAAAKEADLFVSIHFNSAGNPDATGVETFALTAPGYASTSDFGTGDRDAAVYAGNRQDASNTRLAFHIHQQLLGATLAQDRGVRRARFAVLREAPCPAALVECGFLSNGEEEARILSSAYRQDLAVGIAAGIRAYVREVQFARISAE